MWATCSSRRAASLVIAPVGFIRFSIQGWTTAWLHTRLKSTLQIVFPEFESIFEQIQRRTPAAQQIETLCEGPPVEHSIAPGLRTIGGLAWIRGSG